MLNGMTGRILENHASLCKAAMSQECLKKFGFLVFLSHKLGKSCFPFPMTRKVHSNLSLYSMLSLTTDAN